MAALAYTRSVAMEWERKRAALEALSGDLILQATWDGRFYVGAHIEVAKGGLLHSTGQCAASPAEAVEKLWEYCTEIPDGAHLYVSRTQRRVRWNGFMWAGV